MPRDLNIADRCREFGFNVIETSGWRERGKEAFNPAGCTCHHTGSQSSGNMPTLSVLINGRSDLPGPLCHVGFARDGSVYVVAAGRANHAGQGGWKGLTGNSSVYGIEAESNGSGRDWTPIQLALYPRLAAAMISHLPFPDPALVMAHKEWAPHRKDDPYNFDMDAFRANVVFELHHGPNPPTIQENDDMERTLRSPGDFEVFVGTGQAQTCRVGADAAGPVSFVLYTPRADNGQFWYTGPLPVNAYQTRDFKISADITHFKVIAGQPGSFGVKYPA